MLLKPRNMEEMIGQLKALPEHERRVVVFVGRHPNELTLNIAARHHKEWEEHGAVAVRIPAAWTPHGFWKTNYEKTDKEVIKAMKRIPQDDKIFEALRKHGIKTPVVNFHGTPNRRRNGKIEVIIHPTRKDLLDPRETNQPQIRYSFDIDQHIKHPNEVLVEHFYTGVRPNRKTLRHQPLNSPNYSQVSTEYLEELMATREDLAQFDRKGHPMIMALLNHLKEQHEKPTEKTTLTKRLKRWLTRQNR